jgi:hypothetical protein
MERIDRIGPWQGSIPRVDRVSGAQRSADQRKRRDAGEESSPGSSEDDATPGDGSGEDDGHEHIDVTA